MGLTPSELICIIESSRSKGNSKYDLGYWWVKVLNWCSSDDCVFEAFNFKKRPNTLFRGSFICSHVGLYFFNLQYCFRCYELWSSREKDANLKIYFLQVNRVTNCEDYSNQDILNPVSINKAYHQIGYKEDFVMLSKFKKSLLPPVWNALFTILFCCFSERIIGLDNANKLLHTLLYALYSGDNIDLG